MTNPTVINESGNTGTDYKVETRQLLSLGEVQQVQLDIGTGATASPVTASNPLPVDVTGTATVEFVRTSNSVSVTSIAGSATSVELLPENVDRLEAVVMNDSTAILYVLFGAGSASTSNFTHKLLPDSTLIIDKFSGVLNGIWASATGNARVTEVIL